MSAPIRIRSDIDLFDNDVLDNPFNHLKTLRNLGPVAYLNRYNLWYVCRYDQVVNWVRDWKTFSSDAGVGLNQEVNDAWSEALLCEDPPVHTEKRKLFNRQLGPAAMSLLKDRVAFRAEELVQRLLKQEQVDAVTDIAQELPIHVVMDLIGWPERVRPRLIELAAGSFNALGPEGHSRTLTSMAAIRDITRIAEEIFDLNSFAPGSWGDELTQASRQGDWPKEAVCGLLQGYIVAAFDTTIYGISSGLLLFAQNPDQWNLLRQQPELCNQAFTEILRLETPLQHLARVTTCDVDAGEGIVIPKGSRVLFSYASANRDERVFEQPDQFDILRKGKPSLGFGAGVHTCAGQGLARLEASAIYTALAKSVSTFSLAGKPVRTLNNIARGYQSIPIALHSD